MEKPLSLKECQNILRLCAHLVTKPEPAINYEDIAELLMGIVGWLDEVQSTINYLEYNMCGELINTKEFGNTTVRPIIHYVNKIMFTLKDCGLIPEGVWERKE